MAFIRCCMRGNAKATMGGPPAFREMRESDGGEAVALRSRQENPMRPCTQELLFEAVENGEREEVRRHVESGFDINCIDQEDGYTALLLAAELGKPAIVEELLAAGAALDAKDSFGRTALYASAVAGHTEVVDALLRAGADVDGADDDGRTPFWASMALRHLDVAALLLGTGRVDIDARDTSGKSPLSYAVDSGHADCIDFLRANGALDGGGRLNL